MKNSSFPGSRRIETPAVYFTAPGRVEIRPLLLEQRPEELLVTSRLQGISAGTELLFYRGDFPDGISGDLPGLPARLSYPLAYGYSNVGVDEKGRRVFGFVPHQGAWFSREEELILLPEDISDEDAVFLPNLETAVGIVQDLGLVLGETVLVMGLGVVGLLVAELLSRSPAGLLLLADIKEERRKEAEALGALFLNPVNEDIPSRALSLTGGRGLDRAVNVSASGQALGNIFEAMAVEGVVVEASWYGKNLITLGLGKAFHRRRLELRSSQVSRVGCRLGARWDKKRRMDLVLRLLKEIRPSRYITHTLPFTSAPEAYNILSGGDPRVLQTVLSCGDEIG